MKLTLNGGDLVPFFVDEVLPGDTVGLQCTTLARMITPLYPVMDNFYVDSFFFFVPLRLLWTNFQKFMGEQANPGDSTDFTVPQMVSPAVTGYADATLQDHLGIPPEVPDLTHSAFFTRAYNLIWNEWFRDENLQNSVVVDVDDGPDDPADYVLLKRGKRHDYFTSALPWPQKGDAVSLPLGTVAPIQSVGDGQPKFSALTDDNLYLEAGATITTPGVGAMQFEWEAPDTGQISQGDRFAWSDPKLETDLSSATAATINQLRQSFQLQKLAEKDARGGTRYTEIVRAHFGVVSPDQRLQRPEYIGGSSMRINVSPAMSTAQLTRQVGELGGTAWGLGQSRRMTRSFTEHGVLLGLVNVRADLSYQQGLNRMFSRSTKFDYYWPSLAHIGEQSILNKEIFAQGVAADDLTFGYQERYGEYRYKESTIHGKFRSSATATLDPWHLSIDFAALPVLNASFIQDAPPFTRVIAVADVAEFLMDVHHDYRCVRPMPVFSVPGLIDHF